MTSPMLDRIDSYPTHRVSGFPVRHGNPLLPGATFLHGGVNFAVCSENATAVSLVLYHHGDSEPYAELPIPDSFRTGHIWAIVVYELDGLDDLEYGYRCEGPAGEPGGVLSDPYAKLVAGREVWGREPDWSEPYQHRSRLMFHDFDWGDDTAPRIPREELVIYEAHVRGFTRHPSSAVTAPGTYAGLREKLPYLKSLGINAIELMPIFEFDEFENSRVNADTGERLYNFWGYSTVSFYAPKSGYAASGKYGMAGDELKALVRECHSHGIEVILDVVFNHTAEGNHEGPTISFKGLDNDVWYMMTPEGYYYNFSGTGNTMNCNHPVVRKFVLDCLRYWAVEYRIDGFRFDLAAILSRDVDGTPLPNPPILQELAFDPVLRGCVLIAEAWDAAGLYEVGSFPNYHRWSEWNGRYRDTIRRFVKGDSGMVGEMATRYVGSPDLYAGRATAASINFVTAHDGFTLYDLVSYNDKHNEANGEDNRDGGNDNNSWNCGAEGETDDKEINDLRRRQVKNFLALLLTSQGVPMILAGDERGRTQWGNNNAYCHDSDLSWVDWTPNPLTDELVRFTGDLVRFRAAHPAVRTAEHPTGREVRPGLAEISWHGVTAYAPDWSDGSRLMAVMRCAPLGDAVDCVYVVANTHWEEHDVELPLLPDGALWRLAADTGAVDCSFPLGEEPALDDQHVLRVGPRSTVVLCAQTV
ncbi:glycogen debranching protein [Streptosporangium pseudovulgare]|uniref:Glycogen operon protein GlgX homolog n=1 Tax=Streptosporangium pseudovulgare TaxID=35765 RepID=A0ABQ2RJ83_9ACTN|nr:alpha-amylase family glycosyl hydrolase [Streptosporangium pseudovulgare]GGQ33998.1 glycogen operon protein GlgX homolog [Streptosporangium pseudovulgare]